MVRVVRDGEERVRVALPSERARSLIDPIPADVVAKIKEKEIPLEAISANLNQTAVFYLRLILSLSDGNRQVQGWLR